MFIYFARCVAPLAIFGFVFTPSPAPAGFAALDTPSVRERLVERVEELDPQAAIELRGVIERFRPHIIFVPGILGSKLTVKGSDYVLWGKSHVGRAEKVAERLNFCSNVPVQTEVLSTFDIPYWPDETVYGEWIKALNDIKYLTGRKYDIFAYDWRQDMRDTANKFDTFLRAKFPLGPSPEQHRRPLILIAHSMGGLVLTWWYHKHFVPNRKLYGFEIDWTFFLGTPHDGAPSTLKVLTEGYGTSENRYKRFAESSHVEGLDKVAHTFPSLYQLFPPDRMPFVEYLSRGGDRGNVDHFDPDVWRDHEPFKKVHRRFISPYDCRDLEMLLEGGREFHKHLDDMAMGKEPVANPVYYFTNEIVGTPKTLTISQSDPPKWSFGRGDGRVLPESAYNWQRHTGRSRVSPHNLTGTTHQGLVDHPSFHVELKVAIQQYAGRRDEAVLDLALQYPDSVGKALHEKRVTLSHQTMFKDMETAPADITLARLKESLSHSSLRAILAHNLSVLAPEREVIVDSPAAGKIFYQAARDDKSQDFGGRIVRRYYWQLAAAIAADPRIEIPALNNFSHMHLEESNYWEAVKWYRFAESTMRESDAAIDPVLAAKLRNSLGVAYLKLDHEPQAAAQFRYVLGMETGVGVSSKPAYQAVRKKAAKNLKILMDKKI